MSNFGFVKIFGSLLSSTVWVGQAAHRKLMWITMLVKADQDGYVASSIPGLARDAEVTLEQAEDALNHFMSPDRYSRTKEHDGIRIEEVDGGWVLLNHKKYRELRSREAVLNARRQAKFKASRKGKKSGESVAAESESVTPDAGKRRGSKRVTPSVTGVSSVSANANNAQKQIQISEADPDQPAGGDPKDLIGSARAREPDPDPPPEEPVVERVQAAKTPHIATRKVPPEWQPQESHRVNARLYGLDEPDGPWCFANIVAKFRTTTFRTAHWDWDGRFERWLVDTKVERETAQHQAQNGPARRTGGVLGGLQLQPNAGRTGYEGVNIQRPDDDGEAA